MFLNFFSTFLTLALYYRHKDRKTVVKVFRNLLLKLLEVRMHMVRPPAVVSFVFKASEINESGKYKAHLFLNEES